MPSKFVVDAAERIGATAAEAGLGAAIVELGDLPYWWIALLLPALAAGKAGLASFIGRKDTAAALPAAADPASRQ
ncbi:hypothetical protein [Streptomyces sp. NRRL B-24484]|uniref:hypothetical protein n=1 Tax=Streptomyces sp. NRRL B-24484 TaxID=1463833 RepID=UPI0004BF5153|nr:hypothetical protein [Streptomyces sp. NRRL B-24484]